MKTYKEESLTSFEFWAGAKDNAEMLTMQELEELENILEGIYPDGIDETELNDLLRFDFENVCDWLGLEYDAENDEIIRD